MADSEPTDNIDVEALLEKLPPIVALACIHVSDDSELTDEGVTEVKTALEGMMTTPAAFVEAIDTLQEACTRWDTIPDHEGNVYPKVANKIRDIVNAQPMVAFYKEHVTDESV